MQYKYKINIFCEWWCSSSGVLFYYTLPSPAKLTCCYWASQICKRSSFLLSSSEPDWVSVTLGVFVCQGCSLIHRSILSLSQVKSVLQDTFEDKEIEVRHSWFWLKAVYSDFAWAETQLSLISWTPSKSAVISRATEIDWLFAYLKDWGWKPLVHNMSLGI